MQYFQTPATGLDKSGFVHVMSQEGQWEWGYDGNRITLKEEVGDQEN